MARFSLPKPISPPMREFEDLRDIPGDQEMNQKNYIGIQILGVKKKILLLASKEARSDGLILKGKKLLRKKSKY
jgi:hypothetical protein